MPSHGWRPSAALPLLMPAGAGRAAWNPAALAMAAGVAVFVFGTTAESVIIRAVHGNRAELEWLSDVVISMAVTGITYLSSAASCPTCRKPLPASAGRRA